MRRSLWVLLIAIVMSTMAICVMLELHLIKTAIGIQINQYSPAPSNSGSPSYIPDITASPTPGSISTPGPSSTRGPKPTWHPAFDLHKIPTNSPSPELNFPILYKLNPVIVKDFPPLKLLPGQKVAYLTFDDGPAPVGLKPASGTPKLLKILLRHKVRATFFMIGRNVYENPELARQVVADGNVVGNHTWSHINFYTVKGKAFQDEVEYTNKEIYDVTGVRTHLLRPPGGRHPDQSQMDILNKLDMKVFYWNLGSGDWAGDSDRQIVANIQKGIDTKKKVLVILFHDYAFGALDQTIELLQKNGYVFDTLDHFMDSKLPLAD